MGKHTCTKCGEDVFDLLNWDTYSEPYIECPACSHKMVVNFEDGWDGEDEYPQWWVEDYVSDQQQTDR